MAMVGALSYIFLLGDVERIVLADRQTDGL
jgi:hypothetical protein